MKELNQKRNLNHNKIEFIEDGLNYYTGNIINSKQLFIPYEDVIYERITRELTTDKFNLFVSIASLLLMVKSLFGIYDNPDGIYKGLLPIVFGFFVVFSIVTFLGRGKYIYIDTIHSGRIKLFDNNPSEFEIEEFLKKLKTNTEEFLKSKYAVVDFDLPIEGQLENFNYLEKRKVITKEEYIALKNQLKGVKSEIKGFK